MKEQAEIIRGGIVNEECIFESHIDKSRSKNRLNMSKQKEKGEKQRDNGAKFDFLLDLSFAASGEPDIKLALRKVMVSVLDIFDRVSRIGYHMKASDETSDVIGQVMKNVNDGVLSEDAGVGPTPEEAVKSIKLINDLHYFKEIYFQK